MSRHAKPPKNKHIKTGTNDDVKVYVPRAQLSDEQYAELPQERSGNKRMRAVHERGFSKGKLWVIAAAAALFAAAWLLPTQGWIRLATFLIPYILVAIDVVFDAAEALLSGSFFSKDVFMAVSSAGALCIGRGPEGVAMMILYRMGDLLEAFSREKAREANAKIVEVEPYSVDLETEDGVINVLPADVRPGDIIDIAPGECVPLDGEIIQGMTSVNTAALTGSSKPVTLREGMRVISGCINNSRPIRVRVSTDYEHSTAAKVLRLVEDAKNNLSRQERAISRLARLYTPVMLILAVLLAVIPPIFSGGWSDWIGRGLILLMAANLSGLIVSVPITYAGAVNNAYYRGILFKGTKYVEALAKSETMVFNKTGTITEGRYAISDVVPVKMTEHELLTLAATAEMFSEHPIAKALRESCGMLDPLNAEVTQAQEMPGRGVCAFINGKLVYVGNALLMEEHSLRYELPSRSGSAIHVSMDGRYCGHILMNDKVREGAFDALEALRVQGIKNMVMLTGDLRTPAKLTASSLNFDMVKAELLPDGKLSAVEYLMATMAESSMLACVGDAVSEAAVLKRANVGIALGALAANDALDAADVAIMANELKKLPLAYKIAKRSYKAARVNTYICAGAKALLVIFGTVGLLPLWVAAFMDTAAAAMMLLNALGTLKGGDY